MENEEYNLNVSTQEETKKPIEQKTKEEEINSLIVFLNRYLDINSPLVKTLYSLDKGQRDSIIATISDQAITTFGDRYGKEVAKEIIKSLNYEIFTEHIKTLEDFHRYADKVTEVIQVLLKRDEKGEINWKSSSLWRTEQIISYITFLIRGDFDRDLDTLIQMMRDNPPLSQEKTIFNALFAIRDLIKTSEDIERFGQFVRRLSEKGFDAEKILNNPTQIFGVQDGKEKIWDSNKKEYINNPISVQFKEWQAIITDSKKLDDTLSVMEAAFTHGTNPEIFINGIGRRFIKEATPEQLQQLKTYLATISDQAITTFGDCYGKEVAEQIFESLNYEIFVEHIKTPEDFLYYANKVMEVIQILLKRDEKGEINWKSPSLWNAKEIISYIPLLIRGNFNHDLDTLIQMMRDDSLSDQNENIISALASISGIIRTSEDLERFGQFVRRLSEKGFDVKKVIFGDDYGYYVNINPISVFGRWHEEKEDMSEAHKDDLTRFKEWQAIITDSKKLDGALSVMEAAFTHGTNPREFMEEINLFPQNARDQFLQLAQKFVGKNILPQFVIDNLPLLQNCDFSKDGLAVFTSFDIQKKWLEYCVKIWKSNPQNIEHTTKFFSEALSSKIKTKNKTEHKIGNLKSLSVNELTDIQENVDEKLGSTKETIEPNEKLRVYASELLQSVLNELYEDKNFKVIAKIQKSIAGSVEIISALDKTKANSLTQNDLIKFISSLGKIEVNEIFPLTFDKMKEMIFTKLATDQDLADYFVENLDKYFQQPWVAENVVKAIQQYSVAQKFIYAVENDQTVWKSETWVVDVFAKAKVIVAKYQKQFDQDDYELDSYGYSHGNEGFSESDPFANHPWRFSGRQIRIASAISEMMAGKANVQGLRELGINSKEISPLLIEANEKVNIAYQNFLEQIRSNINIKDEDKQALLNPEVGLVKMTSLLDNIRSFVARYFVQSVDGDTTQLSEIGNLSGELDRILAEGFKRYIKIYEVDVPLYDKLYEEFDTLRETKHSPLEVYLGRDGIYAYIGRRAQDIARRRKLGFKGRKKLKEMGEIIEIHPQYIVYPRYFRDNINYETKRQFLEQEGISLDADPLFYDTGYTGTIPEQIMKVMDFSQEDIERRIRLLSAPSVHRRVKGISENARSEIIEYIEHNAKMEETAEGLIIDEKTGKIRHIAQPTNPEEQFYFMMIKQAITRHYWLQEQLHHEPSGNVNLDSEHYIIHIQQKYAKLLPSNFIKNPKEFFKQHNQVSKDNKSEIEYPDEEVVLFKMTDGTEIVAKKIELHKTNKARKEFSIFISAKKAGLPTAEPVGFLFGKEDTDGSYLLTKKIKGVLGRNFDKYLKDLGKFTDNETKKILQQVEQKNIDMADLFDKTLKIGKHWIIKDTIIEMDEETGEIESVIPVGWEQI